MIIDENRAYTWNNFTVTCVYGLLLNLLNRTFPQKTALLHRLQQRLHARLAEEKPAQCGAKAQGHMPQLCWRLSKAWKNIKGALRNLPFRIVPDAPRGLFKAAGYNLVMPEMPHGAAS